MSFLKEWVYFTTDITIFQSIFYSLVIFYCFSLFSKDSALSFVYNPGLFVRFSTIFRFSSQIKCLSFTDFPFSGLPRNVFLPKRHFSTATTFRPGRFILRRILRPVRACHGSRCQSLFPSGQRRRVRPSVLSVVYDMCSFVNVIACDCHEPLLLILHSPHLFAIISPYKPFRQKHKNLHKAGGTVEHQRGLYWGLRLRRGRHQCAAASAAGHAQ